MAKKNVAIVPMNDNKADEEVVLPCTAQDESIQCPFAQFKQYPRIQASFDKALVWLETLSEPSVVLAPCGMFASSRAIYDAKTDKTVPKSWTTTSYAVVSSDSAYGVRLDVRVAIRACARGIADGYKYLNVSLKNGDFDFSK